MRRVNCLDPFLTGVKAASCEGEGSGEVTGEAGEACGGAERRCVAGVSSCCLVSVPAPTPTFAVMNSCRESKLFFNSVYLLFPSATASSRCDRVSHSLQTGLEK